MIQLSLKTKNFYLIADLLFAQPASYTFSTLGKIKTACKGKADTTTVTVEISSTDFIDVYKQLSLKSEGLYTGVNQEMFEQLVPQVEAGVQAGDLEWIEIATVVSQIREDNLALIAGLISNAKSKLNA